MAIGAAEETGPAARKGTAEQTLRRAATGTEITDALLAVLHDPGTTKSLGREGKDELADTLYQLIPLLARYGSQGQRLAYYEKTRWLARL